ncbi:MAG: peptide chain release factor N(5)-glutamine methyltransferase [Rickettsiales bacterium]|nr:MAG: peptide chain release factor N(5)-glutamine methyltransferase [Rickettsiales bacterium]
MFVKEALKQACSKLINSSTPALDARILLCHVLDKTHEQLLISYNDELNTSIQRHYFELIQRRISQEPIAYIIGEQEFYGRSFIVDKNVLIPRPETELIIDSVLENIHHDSTIKILDLGTGSGAIAVTLAKEIITAEIVATDICASALNIAKLNAKKHFAENQIIFKQSNWYENINDEKFDFIISNPPYISYSDTNLVATQTELFEPHLALYAGDDGLYAYDKIIKNAIDYLKNDGKILLEIGFNQFDSVSNILKQNGYNKILLKKDLADMPRIITVY